MRRNLGLLLLLLGLLGCASTPPLEPVNLSAPGWQLQQGQAIWKPGADAPVLVGDVILATHPRGSYLAFSKTLPIATVRWEDDRWEASFPPQDRSYSGRGNPPKRIAWFNLLKAIEGRELPENWIYTEGADHSLMLLNRKTGERLELHFTP